ncbi:MAG: hypothetical protein J5669_07130 [Bacteroidales bacterium]|nr:hypothetical protein [Bacteroidales bacterium]
MESALSKQALLAVYYLTCPFPSLEEAPTAYGEQPDEAVGLVSFVRSAENGPAPEQPDTPIRITKELRVFVGQKELKIRPMAKSVLLLFLRHPEGIVLKRIGDYRAELTALYRRVTRSDDPSQAELRVTRILDLFSNELNVNISRVNAAVSGLVGREKEALYRVEGRSGTAKGIGLDRGKVLWD